MYCLPCEQTVALSTSPLHLFPLAFILAEWRTSGCPFSPPPCNSSLASLSSVSSLSSVLLTPDHVCQAFQLSSLLIFPRALQTPTHGSVQRSVFSSLYACWRNGSRTGTKAGWWCLTSATSSSLPGKSNGPKRPQSAAFPFLTVAFTNIY